VEEDLKRLESLPRVKSEMTDSGSVFIPKALGSHRHVSRGESWHAISWAFVEWAGRTRKGHATGTEAKSVEELDGGLRRSEGDMMGLST
jgi:hypothetical protein